MNNFDIQKIFDGNSQNGKWDEVLILLTGLIDDVEKKNQLIMQLGESNPELAAKCLSADWRNTYSSEQIIRSNQIKYLDFLYTTNGHKVGLAAYHTLLELGTVSPLYKVIKICPNNYLPEIKQTLFRILDRTDSLGEALNEILDQNPHFFLKDVVEYFSSRSIPSELLISTFNKVLPHKEIKPKHLLGIIKLLGINIDLGISKTHQEKFVEHCRNYSDLQFILKSATFKFRLRDVFNLLSNQPINASSSYLILDILVHQSSFSKTVLPKYIEYLKDNSEPDKQAFMLILAKKFNYHVAPKPKVRLNVLNSNFLFQKHLKNKEDYFILFTKVRESILRKNATIDAESLIGRKYEASLMVEWKYHYCLRIIGLHLQVLLPKSEIDGQILNNKKFPVVIIHFDIKTQNLFASTKQIERSKNKYHLRPEDLKIARKGDIFEAKIVKINNKFSCKLFGLGKKTKVNILNRDFPYVQYVNDYIAVIANINSLNEIDVIVGDPIKATRKIFRSEN